MEVCFKCQQPINKNDQFIVGDPDGKQKHWFWYGDNTYSTWHSKPIEQNKYHIHCFNELVKKSRSIRKKRIAFNIIGSIILVIIFVVVVVVLINHFK